MSRITNYGSSLVLGAVLAATLSVKPAMATNGYFSSGVDTESKGMAGSGVVTGEGPVASALNPALGVKMGNVAGGCMSVFMPHRDTTVTGGRGTAYLQNGVFDSDKEIFFVPCAGANYKVQDDLSVGMLLYANGGMNTKYPTNIFSPGFGTVADAPLGVDLAQAFMSANFAYKVTPGITLGVAPIFAMQRFKAYGLSPFGGSSTDRSKLTDNGYDYAYGGGAKVGALWDANSWLSFAVAGQSPIYMTRFDKYAGLFADHGDMDIPPSDSEGVNFKVTPKLDVMLEHQGIYYKFVDSVSNSGNNPTGGTFNWRLGDEAGAGFGYRNMHVFCIGAQWKAMDDLTLRTGYSYNTDFTKNDELLFNILAPATIKHHVSLGASYDITPNWGVSFAYTHAFSQSFTGDFIGVPTNGGSQVIKLRMDQDEASIGLKYRW
ncbi:Outer membrane protein transport protein [Rhodospirillaceae bacterium LM-1]|nr:Outer membrane protein transport protein [Rhodospirillaceae bacterium LM-1]